MKLLIRLIFIVTIATSCENKETQIQRFLLQGNEALKAQDYQSAEYYFQQAITLEPCFADALNNLGVLNFEQNHFDKALEYYNKTLECKATFLPAYFNRANAYYESK